MLLVRYTFNLPCIHYTSCKEPTLGPLGPLGPLGYLSAPPVLDAPPGLTGVAILKPCEKKCNAWLQSKLTSHKITISTSYPHDTSCMVLVHNHIFKTGIASSTWSVVRENAWCCVDWHSYPWGPGCGETLSSPKFSSGKSFSSFSTRTGLSSSSSSSSIEDSLVAVSAVRRFRWFGRVEMNNGLAE